MSLISPAASSAEIPMRGHATAVLLRSFGHWRGEGLRLVEAVE
jgi:hypothetical protein